MANFSEDDSAASALVPPDSQAQYAELTTHTGLVGWLKAKSWRLYLVVALMVLLAAAVIGFTDLRYAVAGAVWKSDASVTVADAASKLPVLHATVALAGQTAFTDSKGVARFAKVRPGKTTMAVTHAGYAKYSQAQIISFGKVKLAPVALKATGIMVTVTVSNALSGETVDGVELKSGDVQASSDSAGRAELIFPPADLGTTATVSFSKAGFNTQTATVPVRLKGAPMAVSMVTAGKTYYLSNRSGKIDLYESNLDGSGATIVLAGTGNEDADTGLLPSTQNPKTIALVTSRDGYRDAKGNLLHVLYIFRTDTHAVSKVEDSFDFGNYRAWVGLNLIYEKNAPGAQCPDIKAYAPSQQTSTTVVSAQTTGSCPKIIAPYDNGFLYSLSQGTSDVNGIYFGYADGGTPKRISSMPSDNTVRQEKTKLLSVQYTYTPNYTETWQSLDLEALTSTKLPNGPANNISRDYNDSPGDKYSSFIEERDGKTELYLTDNKGGNEKKLTALGSVNQFVQWVGDDYIVFSSTKSDENALYTVAVSSGKVTKIADFYRANNRTYAGGYNPLY